VQTAEEILKHLKETGSRKNLEGMKRFAIPADFGVSIPALRKIAKETGKNHGLAAALWKTGKHEARLLACFIDEPGKVTEKQMRKWAGQFDSWDLCDQCCSNLFDKTPFYGKFIFEWSKSREEFVKRAAFALIACKAVHDKQAKDAEFLKFLPLIKREAEDERNFVRKAVNWALRQIGKRNSRLRKEAIRAAQEISKIDSKAAKWIASDALRELKSGKS
jgi:3-methyladenine DNA glycosylase AlkD